MRTLIFFPPAESWLVNLNFPRASRMQGYQTVSSRMYCLSQISRTKHVFDKRTILTIVNALVSFYIVRTYGRTYRSVTWVNYKVFRTFQLELWPERTSMIMSQQSYRSLNGYQHFVTAFKCLRSHVPEYLSSQSIKREEINRSTTRGSQTLNTPLFKTASGQMTFFIIK